MTPLNHPKHRHGLVALALCVLLSAATAVAQTDDAQRYLRLSELMYNPADPPSGPYDNDDFEFVEWVNTAPTTLSLAGVYLDDGVDFHFSSGTVTALGAGDYVLVVRDRTAFESRYTTGLNVAGEYIGSFNNGGERVRLRNASDETILRFDYDDARGWPTCADGVGHALVPQAWAQDAQTSRVLDYGGAWRAGTWRHGSPGQADPVPDAGVVLNEFAAHTDYFSPPYDSNDWIELVNTGATPVTFGTDWFLSDDGDELTKWRITTHTLAASGRVSFDEINDFHNPIGEGFGINKSGERLFLSYLPDGAPGRVVDCVRFKGQENGVSMGRWPDGDPWWQAMPTTRDAANQPGGAVMIDGVVIDKVMYQPFDDDDGKEYIKLHNPTPTQVDLWETSGTWRIDGGVDYTFPMGVSMPPGGVIVLVGFDPTDAGARGAFEGAYGIGAPIGQMFGPWSGSLSNQGERVALERPQAPDLGELNVSWVIVDEMIYFDQAPWPTEPDGNGASLGRLDAFQPGRDPANWFADVATPSPVGTVQISVTPDAAGWSLIDGDGFTHAGTGDRILDAVPVGVVTLTWQPLSFYDLPTPNPVVETLATSQTVAFTGVYVHQTGTVRVHTLPAEGAPWSVFDTAGASHPGAGTTSVEAAAGSITLTWGALAGYDAPTPNPVTAILPGSDVVDLHGVYLPQAGAPFRTLTQIVAYLLGLATDPTGLDVNTDSVVDAGDLVAQANFLPPEPPVWPYPADGATTVSVLTPLGWRASLRTRDYSIWLWPAAQAQPTTPTAGGLTTPYYDPPTTLTQATSYHWQVEAVNDATSTRGGVWSFTTEP